MNNPRFSPKEKNVKIKSNLNIAFNPQGIYFQKNFPKINPQTLTFIKKFYPNISLDLWSDWRWQLSNCIVSVEQLKKIVKLDKNEENAVKKNGGILPLKITPYYLSLIADGQKNNPLRKCVIPTVNEFIKSKGESKDPLEEDKDSPVPNLVHRYPDRVLLLATSMCSSYCRYCTRSRSVGECSAAVPENWEKPLEYIENNKQVRDVLISGGDPLTLSDEYLEYLLSRLRKIKHIEIVRIGTKIPVVLPQRITSNLLKILKKYHPLYISIHFTHPDEITIETAEACEKLADAGIPLGSQTVLLKNVNNNPEVMKDLMQKLLKIRVKPYYIYQCDPIIGSAHFRTEMEDGLRVIEALRGHTSGYAVPQYVIDAPGGGGKIPLLPEYIKKIDENFIYLRNYENKIFKYPKIK